MSNESTRRRRVAAVIAVVVATATIACTQRDAVERDRLDTPLPAWTADSQAVARFENQLASPLRGEDLKIGVFSPGRAAGPDQILVQHTLDLRDRHGAQQLRDDLIRLAELAKQQADFGESHDDRIRPFAYDVSSKGKRRALDETIAMLDRLIAAGGTSTDTLHLLELLFAVQNSFRYPVEKHHQLIPEVIPGLLLQARRHLSVDVGGVLQPTPDPASSSFWGPTGQIDAQELGLGFGRDSVPRYDRDDCEFDGPKTGWGAHPGFDVRCGDLKFRFNLGDERYGGPFNSRIFHALGYNVAPIDPVPNLRLRYDRRVLSQYNSRKLLTMQAKLLFIPLTTRTITDIESPFDRIAYAVMLDGTRVDGRLLGTRLLHDTATVDGQARPEAIDGNYNVAFERTIATLVWQPGTAEGDSEDLRAIGAWDYDQLDHAARREVRALFVLGAWLDQFNLRWENTRLAYQKDAAGWALIHLMSDVGSGLGLARDVAHAKNSDIDAMLWEVTERRTGDAVRFSWFASSMENRAFSRVTADDARWMLRRIGAFTEQQILAGLVATGMSAAEVRLGLEKLLSKRRRMIEDFGLAREFRVIMTRPIDRRLNFDPREQRQLASVTLQSSGGVLVPPVGSLLVRAGRLVRFGPSDR